MPGCCSHHAGVAQQLRSLSCFKSHLHLRRGFASLAEAAEDALAALRAARGPACEAAPALQAARASLTHAPDLAAWRDTLRDVHDSLAPPASTAEVALLDALS
jgi:hypothetical protein